MIYCDGCINIYRQVKKKIDGIEVSNECDWDLIGEFCKIRLQSQIQDFNVSQSREFVKSDYTLVFDSKDQMEAEPYGFQLGDYVAYKINAITQVAKIVKIKLNQLYKGCCRYRLFLENVSGRECDQVTQCYTLIEPRE